MKTLAYSILTLFIGINITYAKTAKANPIFTDKEISIIKTKLSNKNLSSFFKQNGLEKTTDLYYSVIFNIAKRISKTDKDSSGYRLKTETDKDLMVFIVESANYFTNHIDGSQGHYYGLAKLYVVAKEDFLRAMDRSSLNSNEKALMKDVLSANINPGQ